MGNLCSYNFKSKKEVFTWDLTKPYVPTIEKGTVIKIYDGDTITIGGYVKGDPMKYRFSVRLLGIDCPEIKSHDSFEKKHALEGKQYLEFMGDIRLKSIGLPAYFGVTENPFPWIDEFTQGNMIEVNFFEGRVREYQSGTLEW